MAVSLAAGRRRIAYCCLDWSEKRLHLGGVLGGALLGSMISQGPLARKPGSRALEITPRLCRAHRAPDLRMIVTWNAGLCPRRPIVKWLDPSQHLVIVSHAGLARRPALIAGHRVRLAELEPVPLAGTEQMPAGLCSA